MKNIFKNIGASAPVWMQQAMGIILILQGAKMWLVNGLPFIHDDEMIKHIGLWYDWLLQIPGFAIAIMAAISKKKSLNDKAEK
jgi:hypothetical protein